MDLAPDSIETYAPAGDIDNNQGDWDPATIKLTLRWEERQICTSTTLTGDMRHANLEKGERAPGLVGEWGLSSTLQDRLDLGWKWTMQKGLSSVDQECTRKGMAFSEGEAWGCCSEKEFKSHESSWQDWTVAPAQRQLSLFFLLLDSISLCYWFAQDSLSTIYHYRPFSGSFSIPLWWWFSQNHPCRYMLFHVPIKNADIT